MTVDNVLWRLNPRDLRGTLAGTLVQLRGDVEFYEVARKLFFATAPAPIPTYFFMAFIEQD